MLTVEGLEKLGDPEIGLKPQTVPVGSPLLQERVTVWVAPLASTRLILLEPEFPCVRVIIPELDMEKSKARGWPETR